MIVCEAVCFDPPLVDHARNADAALQRLAEKDVGYSSGNGILDHALLTNEQSPGRSWLDRPSSIASGALDDA